MSESENEDNDDEDDEEEEEEEVQMDHEEGYVTVIEEEGLEELEDDDEIDFIGKKAPVLQ